MHQSSTAQPSVKPPSFIATIVIDLFRGVSAVAVLNHNGDLTLAALLPNQLRHQLLDREGLLAHLIQWVPSLPAITDVFVSWLLPATDIKTSDPDLRSSAADAPHDLITGRPSSLPLLLRTVAWLGPRPHAVAPAAWQGTHASDLHPRQAPEQLYADLPSDLAPVLRHSTPVEDAAVRLGLYGLITLGFAKAAT